MEKINVIDKVRSLIAKANEAYQNAAKNQENEYPLMDKNGNSYKLNGPIVLDKQGFVVFPLECLGNTDFDGDKIRAIVKKNGEVVLFNSDLESDWRDAAKLMRHIIRWSEIGNEHFSKYDPNWEDSVNGKESLKAMNKEIGRKADAGMEYMNEGNKKVVKLNEEDFRKIISESITKALKESAGHLYGKDENGVAFTNSKEKWHGVKGTTFIWHGEWSDPEVWYKGQELNGTELEEYMWEEYKYECEEDGTLPSEEEYDNLPSEWFAEKLEDYVAFGKLDESKLMGVIKNSVRKFLKESFGQKITVDPAIEQKLMELGANVNKFYTDEDNLVVSLNQYDNKAAVRKLLHQAGFDLYDAGSNGNVLIMTFKKL